MMQAFIDNFHFLRPEWFFALIPAVLLFILLKTREARGSRWEDTIDPHLLPFLLDISNARVARSPLSLLLVAWIIGVVALAGPVWEKSPRPVQERENALVVILDLSRSMYATDVKPNRLTRAKRKLHDLLTKREEGVTGLVVFAGDAHAAMPLTDDTDTIAAMIPALGPEIMPAAGSRVAPALKVAQRLLQDAGAASGRILIITDEIRDRASALEVAREHRYAWAVSVMAVGTPGGAPVPLNAFGSDGYLKNSSGVLVIPQVDIDALRSFANAAGGRFSRMTLTDEDLDYLLAESSLPTTDDFRAVERNFDIWLEQGPWLVLLLLPLAALAFRRGWLWSVALLVSVHSQPADAAFWNDLWQTRHQQGMEALTKGKADKAAKLFENPAWQGTAHYRGEDYSGAAEAFANLDTSDGQYNYGNALARQHQFEQAIAAYEKALELNSDNQDAAFNKRLIEDVLESRKQQQRNDQANDKKPSQQNRDGDESQTRNQKESGQQGQQEQQKQQQADQKDEHNQQKKQRRADRQEQKDKESRQQQMAEATDPLKDEERQALEQWLRRVPDDPGGLLRRKFLQQYEEKLKRGEITRDESKDW